MQPHTQQPEFDFTTKSPINKIKLNEQNTKIYNHLLEGRHINRYEAGKLYGVGNLHSRIPEVFKFIEMFGISHISRKLIKTVDYFGKETQVMDYWLTEEDIIKIKNQA